MKCQLCDAALAADARFCSQCGAAVTTGKTAEEVRQHAAAGRDDLGASIAKGAAIGAVIALPVPFIGPLTGAIVGAGIAAYNKLSRD
jgi:hypothetical protein